MRRTLILLTVVALGLSMTSHAGLDPSPFREEINKFKSIQNNMKNLGGKLNRLLADPPDPLSPNGNLTSAVNELSAMAHKLDVLDRRMTDVMDVSARLHVESPSEPLQPLILAAEGVQIEAQMMDDAIGAYIETTPHDQIPPEFLGSLKAIERRVAQVPLKLDMEYYSYRIQRTIPIRFVQHVQTASQALTDAQLQAALDRTNNIFRPAGVQFVMSYNIPVINSYFAHLYWDETNKKHIIYNWGSEDPNSSDIVWPLLWPDRDECPELYIPEPAPGDTYFKETSYWAQMRAGTYCGRPEEILVYINLGWSTGGQYPWYSRIVGMTRSHMFSNTFPHEIGHYLGLPHTFPGLDKYSLDYNFGRLIGVDQDPKPDPTQIYRFYETTDHLLDPETEAMAPFSLFWDLVFAMGGDPGGRLFFNSRESAARYDGLLQPIEQWHNGVLCHPSDPECEPSTNVRLRMSVAAGCTGQDGETDDCLLPARDYYTGDPEVAAFSRPGSRYNRIQWNVMSYDYKWTDGSKVDPSVVESVFLCPSQIEQIKRVLQYDVETLYEGQKGLRPHLGVCFRCHSPPNED